MRVQPRRARVFRGVCVAVAGLLVATCASRAEDVPASLERPRVRYVYDGSGRLAAVGDAEGASASYVYDAVGNIVGVERGGPGAGERLESPSPAEGLGPPVVDDVSPVVVAPGDEVTVEGRGFSGDRLLDLVVIDGSTYAEVVSASETELRGRVPATATPGRVSVATPAGSDRSDGDVFVAPRGYAAGDVESVARGEVGEPVEVDVGGRGSVALVRFAGERGQRVGVSLREGGGSSCGVGLGVVGPGGSVLRDAGEVGDLGEACAGEGYELARLPVDGTYTLVVAPRGDGGDSLTLTVDELDPDDLPSPEDGAGDSGEGDDRRVGGERDGEAVPEGLDPELLEPPSLEDVGAGPAPGGPLDGAGGFPVDLSTGLVRVEQTDLVVGDVVPVSLSRTYQVLGRVPAAGAFGVGSPLGLALVLEVSPGTQFAQLELPTGAQIGFVRTSEGTDPDDGVLEHRSTPTAFYGARITWNGGGWDLTLADGTTLVFGENTEPGLRAVRDRHGNQTTVVRERDRRGRAAGEVVSVHSPTGRSVSLRHDEAGRVVEVRDHLGRAAAYGYDGQGRLASVSYSWGDAIGYTYDGGHRLTGVTGPGGVTLVVNRYDRDGRVVRQELGDGAVFTFAYTTDGEGLVTEAVVTDPAGMRRRVSFEGGHWVSDHTAVGTPQERRVAVERDPESLFVTGFVDGAGGRTAYGYDDAGNLTEIAGPGSTAAGELAYDGPFHQVSSATDPAGSGGSFDYDDAGHLAGTVDPAGGEASYRHDGRGRLVEATDGDGNTTRVDYELSHRVTVTDPAGEVSSEFYDAAGRLAVVTDPDGHRTHLAYDDLDRVTAVTDPQGRQTRFGYDAAGNVASVRDAAGNTTSYAYDPAGRLTARTDPAGAVDRYAYDGAGNLVSHTDRRGVVTTTAYDVLGRPTRVAYGVDALGGAESTVTYGYDAADRLVEVNDSTSGRTRLTYDEAGRLIGESSPQGEITYAYDDAGRRTAMAVADGPETTYTYDDETGALDTIARGEAAVSVERDGLGQASRLRLPNDITTSYTYDDRGHVTQIDHGHGSDDTALGSLGYQHDPTGRRTAVAGDLAETAARLPGDVPAAGVGAGNRLTRWDGQPLAYDEAGNLVDDGTNTYTWDARGQLTSIDGPVPAHFTYDAFGRRTAKTVNGEITRYLYDRPNVLQQQVGDEEPVTYLTGPAPDEIYARTDTAGDEVTTYLRDAQGSVVGLVGPDGTLDTTYSYTPFGQTTADGASDPNPFAYTGRELDETGLYYYRARYYSPETGRFLSEDPLEFTAGDPNLYAYVRNDPVDNIDPTGTCIATSLVSLALSFELIDQTRAATEAFTAGEITADDLQIVGDNVIQAAEANFTFIITACGVEAALTPHLTNIVGRGFSPYGRTPTTPARNPTTLHANATPGRLPTPHVTTPATRAAASGSRAVPHGFSGPDAFASFGRQLNSGSPDVDVGHAAAWAGWCSWGRRRSMGPAASMTSARAASAEWNP